MKLAMTPALTSYTAEAYSKLVPEMLRFLAMSAAATNKEVEALEDDFAAVQEYNREVWMSSSQRLG